MTKTTRNTFIIRIIVLIAFALFSSTSNSANAFDFSGWRHGGSGYEQAYQQALDQEDPLIIYFSTDWCGWCTKLNAMYLKSSDVQAALGGVLKVNINPDKGSVERKLQGKYGVRGFPAFLVAVPALGERPVRVHPFRSNGFLSTADFIKAINMSVEQQYHDKAISLAEQHQYDKALRFFTKALNYYGDNPSVWYDLGLTYLAMAQKDRSSDYLNKADESYRAALDIEAGHERAKNDLKKVEQLRAEWEKEGEPALQASD